MIGEFELDNETQLKVVPPGPDSTDFELPEHVNVLFLQTIEGADLPAETVQGLKVLLRDHPGHLRFFVNGSRVLPVGRT